MAGGLTVLPARKHWAESLNETISPYLQLAFQNMIARKQAETQFQREKEMKQIPTPLPPELAGFYKQLMGQGQPNGTGQSQMEIDPATNLPKIGGLTISGMSRSGVTFRPKEETPEEKIQTQAKQTALKETQVNLSKVERLSPIVDTIEKEWMKTNPQPGFQGRMIGIGKLSATPLQMDKNTAAYRTFVKGMRAQLARAMGDVGNLSEPEQKAAMDLVPSLADNYETGVDKINKVRTFIETLKQGNVEAAKSILGGAYNPGEQIPSIPQIGQSFNGEKVINVQRIE